MSALLLWYATDMQPFGYFEHEVGNPAVIHQIALEITLVLWGGYVARYMGDGILGDGILVYFGYSQAHENNAGRGIMSALNITSSVPTPNSDPALAVRVGAVIFTEGTHDKSATDDVHR